MAEEKIPSLGDVVKKVANLELYQQRVAEGKTSNDVIYLVLAERKVFYNGEDWSGGGDITVDSEMSDTSENAVQNKIVKAYIDNAVEDVAIDTNGLATKEELNSKQDKIDDLDAIRSGATKGATALQSYTEKYTGTITGITMNGVSKGTSGVVNLGTVITAHQDISSKQDKLISGTNIRTINGQSILGSGDITIEGGGGGGSSSGDSSDSDAEAVIAAAFNDLNNRIDEDKASYATKADLAKDVAAVVAEIENREEVTAAALADLNARVTENREYLEDYYLTSEGFAEYMDNLTAEIQDNERVIAAALTDINQKLSALLND